MDIKKLETLDAQEEVRLNEASNNNEIEGLKPSVIEKFEQVRESNDDRLQKHFNKSRNSIGSLRIQQQLFNSLSLRSKLGGHSINSLNNSIEKISESSKQTDDLRRINTEKSINDAKLIVDNGTEREREAVSVPINAASERLDKFDSSQTDILNRVLDTFNQVIGLLTNLIEILRNPSDPSPTPPQNPDNPPNPAPNPEPAPNPSPTPIPSPTPNPSPQEARAKLANLGITKEAIDFMFDKTAVRFAQLAPEALVEKVAALTVGEQKSIVAKVGKLSDADFETLKNSSIEEQKTILESFKPQSQPNPTPNPSPNPVPMPNPGQAPTPAEARRILAESGMSQEAINYIYDQTAVRLAQLSPDVIKSKVAPLSISRQKSAAINVGKLTKSEFETLKNAGAEKQKELILLNEEDLKGKLERQARRVALSRVRLVDVGFTEGNIKLLSDPLALKVAMLDDVILTEAATQGADKQKALAAKVDELPQSAFDKLILLRTNEQLRISKLNNDQIAEELNKLSFEGNSFAAKKRLIENSLGIKPSTLSRLTDDSVLRLVTFDQRLLLDISLRDLSAERSFVDNASNLPQSAIDRFRSVSLSDQKRISSLGYEEMLQELARIPAPSKRTPDTNLVIGNPTNATSNIENPNNFLISRKEFVLSYDRDKGTPNWVSWHLDSNDIGSVPRNNEFMPDETLPDGWYRAQPADYQGSGYDRGHMTPAADRSSTFDENGSTFTLSNIIPQAPNNNRKTWAGLEDYCRELVRKGNELYITSGSYGSVGTLADGKINIPARTWKVIVVLPRGENDLSRINKETRVIAVDIPNNNNLVEDWSVYRTSAFAIEKSTGYDLLSNISKSLQNELERKVDRLEIES